MSHFYKVGKGRLCYAGDDNCQQESTCCAYQNRGDLIGPISEVGGLLVDPRPPSPTAFTEPCVNSKGLRCRVAAQEYRNRNTGSRGLLDTDSWYTPTVWPRADTPADLARARRVLQVCDRVHYLCKIRTHVRSATCRLTTPLPSSDLLRASPRR